MAFKTDAPNEDLFAGGTRDTRRTVAVLVDEIADAVEALKEAEAVASKAKDKLKALAKDKYWEVNFGGQPVHTFDANGRNSTIQINFPNKYDLDADKFQRLATLLGNELTMENYFAPKTIVNVDVTDLEKEQMVAFFKEMSAVTKKYGLQGYVDDKFEVAPEFHDVRHELMPQINKAVDAIIPVQVHITT